MPFITVEGKDHGDVRIFAMSTCAWCDRMKKLCSDNGVQYRYIDVDTLEEVERKREVAYLDSIYPEWGFPCMLFDGRILIVGYQEKEIREALGLPGAAGVEAPAEAPEVSEKARRIMERLQRYSEKKGAALNPDSAVTVKLVNSLLVNQERYGYWACPCMLATGEREEDRDIICPCRYWEEDANEFGACFCGLFVSKKVLSGEMTLRTVPERRKRNGP